MTQSQAGGKTPDGPGHLSACPAVFDLIREGLFSIQNEETVFCNRPLCEMLELEGAPVTREQLVARLTNTADVADRAQMIELLAGKAGEIRLTIQLPAGKSLKLHVTTCAQDSSSAGLIGLVRVLPVFQDINDLREAILLLNALFDSIEDGILILDPATMEVQRANPAAARIFGSSIEALQQQTIPDLLADGARRINLVETITAKLPLLREMHLDLDMLRSNGAAFPALHSVSEITDERGDVVALIWIVLDMTQRTFLNRTLIDLETRYRLLFDRSADPTLIVDAASRKIIDANAAAEMQLGYSRSELIGLSMDQITPDSRHSKMYKEFDSIKVGDSATVEGINLTKEGVEVQVQVSVVATEFEGHRVYIANCRDVSQQKLLERERMRLEKLDAAQKVAGGLAHELSQPLQGLMTIVDLMQQPNLSQEAQIDLALKIPPSVERMVGLLEQMKRIVRLETKPYTGVMDIVDIRQSSH